MDITSIPSYGVTPSLSYPIHRTEMDAEMKKAIEEAAEEVVQQWQAEMAKAVENLERAQLTFDDLEGERRTQMHAALGF